MKKIFGACLLLLVAILACRLGAPEPNDFPPRPTVTEGVAPVKATEAPTVPLTPVGGGGYPAVVLKARDALAATMNVSAEKIEVIKVEPVNWPDGCLGVSKPGIMCAMMITPGYRVILRLNNFDYEYHTDAKSTVVMASLQPGIIP